MTYTFGLDTFGDRNCDPDGNRCRTPRPAATWPKRESSPSSPSPDS